RRCAAFRRIQSGFLSFSTGMILIGMRAVLACDFCLAVASYGAGETSVGFGAGLPEAAVVMSIPIKGSNGTLHPDRESPCRTLRPSRPLTPPMRHCDRRSRR